MNPFDPKKSKDRLKSLRESRGWSPSDMAAALDKLIGENALDIIKLGGDTGRQTVAQLESTRRITIDIAFAYAEIFGVSLDYVLGKSEDWQPEYGDIKERLGLSDEVVNKLIWLKNQLEGSPDFTMILFAINAVLGHKEAFSLFMQIFYYSMANCDKKIYRLKTFEQRLCDMELLAVFKKQVFKANDIMASILSPEEYADFLLVRIKDEFGKMVFDIGESGILTTKNDNNQESEIKEGAVNGDGKTSEE